jgi:hypothetical protein
LGKRGVNEVRVNKGVVRSGRLELTRRFTYRVADADEVVNVDDGMGLGGRRCNRCWRRNDRLWGLYGLVLGLAWHGGGCFGGV